MGNEMSQAPAPMARLGRQHKNRSRTRHASANACAEGQIGFIINTCRSQSVATAPACRQPAERTWVPGEKVPPSSGGGSGPCCLVMLGPWPSSGCGHGHDHPCPASSCITTVAFKSTQKFGWCRHPLAPPTKQHRCAVRAGRNTVGCSPCHRRPCHGHLPCPFHPCHWTAPAVERDTCARSIAACLHAACPCHWCTLKAQSGRGVLIGCTASELKTSTQQRRRGGAGAN